jgi:hypothetical protein
MHPSYPFVTRPAMLFHIDHVSTKKDNDAKLSMPNNVMEINKSINMLTRIKYVS